MSETREEELAHEVLITIRQIVRRISEHSRSMSREIGLTVPQLMCVKAIGTMARRGEVEITNAMVSRAVQLNPATTSRILDRLSAAGLVERTRSATDRRRTCLSLTEEGQARFTASPAPLQERFVARLLALPEAEQQALLDALSRITQLMDADTLDAAPILTTDADLRTPR